MIFSFKASPESTPETFSPEHRGTVGTPGSSRDDVLTVAVLSSVERQREAEKFWREQLQPIPWVRMLLLNLISWGLAFPLNYRGFSLIKTLYPSSINHRGFQHPNKDVLNFWCSYHLWSLAAGSRSTALYVILKGLIHHQVSFYP